MQAATFLAEPKARKPPFASLRADPKALASIGAGIAGGITYVTSNAVAASLSCAVPATFVASSIELAALV